MESLHRFNSTVSQRSRITVALLNDRLYYGYPIEVFQGVKKAAQEHNIHLICVAGGIPNDPTGEHLPGTVLYGLVGSQNVDGVLVMSGLLSTFLSRSALLAFYRQYHHLPLVSLGIPIPGYPSLLVDNYSGMHSAVSHLIEVHKCRKIACIRGPEGHQEAEERYRAYADALTQHGLPVSPELITVGTFMPESGKAAIAMLQDERQVQFDAIVAGNDWMLNGAVTALRKRNIQVPEQVAAVGFDDLDESRCANPPLTTVRQPFSQMGLRAIELLLAQIAGEKVPEITMVPTELVVRQSCGCHFAEAVQAEILPEYSSISVDGDSYQKRLSSHQHVILAEIHQATNGGTGKFQPHWLERLLRGYTIELEEPTAKTFLPALNTILQQAVEADCDISRWQTVLSVLRRHSLALLKQSELLLRAEHLWQQARVVIAETVRLEREARELRVKQQNQLLRQIGARLLTTFELKVLLKILSQELPTLDIPYCFLGLYENSKSYEDGDLAPKYITLMPVCNDKHQTVIPPEGKHFPSNQLLPKELLPRDRASAMVLVPLYFQREQLGFIFFEDHFQEPTIYNALRVEISNALQGALLVDRLQTHAQQLAAANKEIQVLNAQLKEDNLRMGAELEVSQRIQQMMLPSKEELQQIEGLDIVGYMKPAGEIGGDYYDVLTHDGKIHIGVGDVTGHGLESGLLMLMTQTAIRTLIESGEMDATTFLNTINRTLYKNIQRMQVDKMLTLVFLNYQDGRLRIIGQHEDVLVIRQGGKIERIDTLDLGFPLGLECDISNFIAEATIFLGDGESVVLYTDGITEAENRQRTMYGLERLCGVLSRHWQQSAEQIKEAVLNDVTRHIGDHIIYDDLTLVVFKQRN